MGTAPLRVVLRMEISLLSTALAQVLGDDPRLDVEVRPPGVSTGAHDVVRSDGGRTVELRVLEDPSRPEGPARIELCADGQTWILPYRGLPDLAQLLADFPHLDAALAVSPDRR